jgi:hypothetical protein
MRRFLGAAVVGAALAAGAVPAAQASAGPVGALPKGPVVTVSVPKGELIAVALPNSSASSGLVWRVARPFNGKIVSEATEGDLGSNVVVVFKATGVGNTKIVYALTKGESAKAQKSKTYVVHVSGT